MNTQFRKLVNKHKNVSDEELQNAFISLHQITYITKYKNFQYRLLHNVIYANDRLYHNKKVSTQKCEFCGSEKQSTMHLLFNCKRISKIWDNVVDFFTNFMGINVKDLTLNEKNILLNTVHIEPLHIVNLLCLVIKQYIFCSKCKNAIPTFMGAVKQMHQIFLIEKYNAISNNEVHKFELRWKMYIEGK